MPQHLLLDADQPRPGFDFCDAGLTDAQPLAELRLRQPALLAQGTQVSAELVGEPDCVAIVGLVEQHIGAGR
jgi:hypothetical protein